LVACAQPAAVGHSIDGTGDSEFSGILYGTSALETIGRLLVTGHGQLDWVSGAIECQLTIESYFIVG
jgi:hypothetical protein